MSGFKCFPLPERNPCWACGSGGPWEAGPQRAPAHGLCAHRGCVSHTNTQNFSLKLMTVSTAQAGPLIWKSHFASRLACRTRAWPGLATAPPPPGLPATSSLARAPRLAARPHRAGVRGRWAHRPSAGWTVSYRRLSELAVGASSGLGNRWEGWFQCR